MEPNLPAPASSGSRTLSDLSARSDLAVAAALCFVYLALMPGHYQSVDGVLLFTQARSLWYEGSLIFADPVVWEIPYTTSFYGIGHSLVYLPGVIGFSFLEPLVYVPGDGLQEWGRLYLDPVYAAGGNAVQALATASTAWAIGRIGHESGLSGSARRWSMVLYGLGSYAFVYAGADFSQPLAGACAAFALLFATRAGRASGARAWVLCCACLFWMVLTRPLEAVLFAPFIGLVGLDVHDRDRSFKWAGGLCIALALGIGVSLLVNTARFGSPFHNAYTELGASFVVSLAGPLGLLLSPGRGLLFAFPAILLAPIGFGALRHRGGQTRLAWALAGYPIILWIVMGSWHMWWGGVGWGPRLLVPALPFMAVLAGRGLAELEPRAAAPVAWTLLALGLAFALPGVLVDLHAGYGAISANPDASWAMTSHPALGGWRGLDHVFATDALDRHAVDVLWLRIVRTSNPMVLVVPTCLLVAAAWLARRSIAIDAAASPATSEP